MFRSATRRPPAAMPANPRRTGAPVVRSSQHGDVVEIVVEGPVHDGNVDRVWWAVELELETDAACWVVDLSHAAIFAPIYYELVERCSLLVGDRSRLSVQRPANIERAETH